MLEFLSFAAKYPFTPIAKDFLKHEHAIDWTTMERAAQRIEEGLHGEIVPVSSNEESILMREVLSFAISKAIASLCRKDLAAKWIAAEAKRSVKLLRKNNKDIPLFCEQLGIEVDTSTSSISIKSYLRFIPKEESAKLALQDVRMGYVIVSENRLYDVFFEAALEMIQKGFPISQQKIPASILDDVKDFAAKINERHRIFAKKIVAKGIPPCMQDIIQALQAGEKVPHSARWVIATFLLRRGHNEEKIIELFSTTPNFNLKRTKYHIEHIKRKGYTTPSCATIDSLGLCKARCPVKNPLQYREEYAQR